MKQQLLLLEDVDGLGRSGDIVSARPGYVRNYLIPSKKAIIAGAGTLRLQEKLKEQRRLQAVEDRKESERIALALKELVFDFQVRVDSDNNMYGSVTISDIINAAAAKGISLNKKNFPHAHYAVKTLGRKSIPLKLKEEVIAHLVVEVVSDRDILPIENVSVEAPQEQFHHDY